MESLNKEEKEVIQVSLELFKSWMKIMYESNVHNKEQHDLIMKFPTSIKSKLDISETAVDRLDVETAVKKMYSNYNKKH